MSQTTLTLCLHRGRGVISRLIQWQTRGAYSHASLVFPDGSHFEAREGKGVVWHRFFTPNDGDDVTYFPIAITADQLAKVQAFCRGELGRPYDWRAVAMFVSRRTPGSESEEKWFCSEIAYAALLAVGIALFRETQPWQVSPDLLARSPLLPDPVSRLPVAA